MGEDNQAISHIWKIVRSHPLQFKVYLIPLIQFMEMEPQQESSNLIGKNSERKKNVLKKL